MVVVNVFWSPLCHPAGAHEDLLLHSGIRHSPLPWNSASFPGYRSCSSGRFHHLARNVNRGVRREAFGREMITALNFSVENMRDQVHKSIRIHYHRNDAQYDSWGLYAWGATNVDSIWDKPLPHHGEDEFGVYWELATKDAGALHFIVRSHDRDIKDFTGIVEIGTNDAVWIVSENPTVFEEKPDLTSIPRGDLVFSRAFWVAKNILAYPPSGIDGPSFHLHASKDASLQLTGKGVEGADITFQMEAVPTGLPAEVLEKFPHISDFQALRLPEDAQAKVLVKCQLAVSVTDSTGNPLDATSVQVPGVLDDCFKYDGPLGSVITLEGVSLHLWAPTAQRVRLLLFTLPSGGEPDEEMKLDEKDGVWSVQGPAEWIGKYYLYEVTVFHPTTMKVEISFATDPYSRGLSANGERSLIIDLKDSYLYPSEWDNLKKPVLKNFTDIAIYELHIRDFSISDESVNQDFRGTYLAFAEKESSGVKHLKALAEAGLSHVHLLPCYDFASVDERKENWKHLDVHRLSKLAPDSDEQQAAVTEIQDEDGFNWGYDPVHWGVPEGSYATNPDGPERTLEFRKMVQGLNGLGLRVVLDVVYNHLHGSGPTGIHSCLDKVVPGYYLRRSKSGMIENSTCMNNTASEHYMMDRLIVDDLRDWAIEYKVDGFRFDLMGHIMKKTMTRAKEVLRSLTLDKEGVDGSKIYLYGEGWDFGEIANNGRGVNASQRNLAGTGIGSFNDRIRDGLLGGSPFGDILCQGFLTGLSLQPNDLNQGSSEEMASALAATTDWIRLGLAGNLKDYVFTNYLGEEVKGRDIVTHGGVPVAYTSSPEEVINYVSAHDNESLFDVIMLKAPKSLTLEERCRMNHVASSVIALSQGIPFFHAGDEMLRSKSLDRDSYNSGDWFNRLDFSYSSNNFGVGLPPKSKNSDKWPIMRSLLGNPALKPDRQHILTAVANFKDLLKIRFSSPLFHLPTGIDIQTRVRFHNTGPRGVPGAIIMSIDDDTPPGLTPLDPKFSKVVIVFNARPTRLETVVRAFKTSTLCLHPVQMASSDEVVKTSVFDSRTGSLDIPARTTAVFVVARHTS